MSKGRWIKTALWLCLLFMPFRLWASDLISSKAYFEDASGKLTFAEVQDKPFTPFTGILTEGFSGSAYWLRLRIDPRFAQGQPALEPAGGFPPTIHLPSRFVDTLVLRVRPPYLDQIELFDPLEPDRINRVTGNILPWLDDEFRSLNHGFLIPRGDGPRDVWLRVVSTSTMLVGVDALPYDQMRALEKRQEILNTLDVALTLFFIVWAGLLFALRPDRLVGAFLVVMVVSFFYATNYMGYYRIYLGQWAQPQFFDQLQSALIMLLPASYMLFNRRLLQDYRPSAWMMRMLLPAQYYFVIGWVVLLLGHEWLALPFNAALAFLSQVWVCVILVTGMRADSQHLKQQSFQSTTQQHPQTSSAIEPKHTERQDISANAQPVLSRGWVLAYSAFLAIQFGALVLPALGLVPALVMSQYRSIIQGALPFLLMAVIVHLRNRRLEREQQRQVLKAEQEAASEKNRREESEQFLAMLTHEIRTPLTVMAYASKTDLPEGQLGEHVKSGIREIDELIERCVQADRADQSGLPLVLTQTTVELALHAPRTRFVGERVDWRIDVASDQPLVSDLTLVEVVLNNLIDNALKYSAADTRVKVHVYRQGLALEDGASGLMVSVSNSLGPAGLPDPKRLFEKYYRAPRAHIRTGSGLGLYVARSFAQKLGGRLDYHHTTDWVRFDLWLPL